MADKVVFAIGAHPDDIEFMMAGTLILLKKAGWECHYISIANGSCGSQVYSAAKLRKIRCREAMNGAKIIGAIFHNSLVDDLEIFYEQKLIRCLASIIREVKPRLILTHSLEDYMEDHINSCRIAVTAAFVRSAPNYRVIPPRKAINDDVTIYHSMPQGLRDQLRRRVIPGAFVDTTEVQKTKRTALAQHNSQRVWLDSTQKMDLYLNIMEKFSLEVGRMSGKFKYAEGWRRHLHYGYCNESDDPLKEALGENYLINEDYEKGLELGV